MGTDSGLYDIGIDSGFYGCPSLYCGCVQYIHVPERHVCTSTAAKHMEVCDPRSLTFKFVLESTSYFVPIKFGDTLLVICSSDTQHQYGNNYPRACRSPYPNAFFSDSLAPPP